MTDIRVMVYQESIPAVSEDHFEPSEKNNVPDLTKLSKTQIVEGLTGWYYTGMSNKWDVTKYVYSTQDGSIAFSHAEQEKLIRDNMWKADHNLWQSPVAQLKVSRRKTTAEKNRDNPLLRKTFS